MTRNFTYLIGLIFVVGLVGRTFGLTEYTYTISPIPGLCGSTEPAEIRLTGFASQHLGSSVYLGTWGAVKDGIGWAKYRIPDYPAICQTITKVELSIDIAAYMGGPTGVKVNRVEDDSWTAAKIRSDWIATNDEVLTPPQQKRGVSTHDITSWLSKPGEGEGAPLSLRFTRVPDTKGYTVCLRTPTLTITTVSEPGVITMLAVGGLAVLRRMWPD